MKDFITPTQTVEQFMADRGFTLVKGKFPIWIAKLQSGVDSVNGMDRFLVVDEDLGCLEIWEFDPQVRKLISDDTLAAMISNVSDDLPTGVATGDAVDNWLFRK